MAYNTGNPIGSTDPRDAADNKENFDRFALSTERTYTDRLGVERKTVTGALQDYAAYNSRGVWTTATAYNVNDVWRNGPTGAFYLVLADYTSGASAAADIAGGNVVVHQPKDWVVSVDTIADLRNLEPAFDGQQIELLGHTIAGVGGGVFYADFSSSAGDDNGVTVVTTGGRRWVRKLEGYVTPQMFGAIGDGVNDDSVAFIAARTAAAGTKIYAAAGIYKLNSALNSSEDLIIEGDGPTTVLDFTGAVSGGSYAIDAIGTATQIENLSGIQEVGSYSVTFASAPSLSVGDVFVIYNPTNSSWSSARTNYRAGEWCEVVRISGNVVTVRNRLYDTYNAGDVWVYKITGPRVSLRNFYILGTSALGLVKTTLCKEPLIENIKASHANDSVIYFDRCFKPTVINPDIVNIGDGGDDYGVAVGNSQHTRIIGGYIFSRRHAVTTGGNAEICCVPVRDCRTIGSVLKNDPGSATFAADFHGNTEDSSYINCTIYGGGAWQGKDVGYDGCTIYADVNGIIIYSAEIKGGRFFLTDCNLISNENPQPIGRALVDIGGQNDAIAVGTVLPCSFIVEDCTLHGRNLSSLTTFVYVRNAGTSEKINLSIQNVFADLDYMGSILRTSLDSGTADSDFIIVDNIKNFPNGTTLHAAEGSHYLNFPHKLQKQTGKVTLTATVGTSYTTSAPIPFKYTYPRQPSGHATSVGGYVGNRMAYGTLGSITTTTITPMIASGDATNWSATLDRPVSWSAFIDEV